MDEEPTGVRPERAIAIAKVEEKPAVQISRLRTEIDATRDELGTYISELDRRRHEALDLKHQVKKHPGLAIGAGVAVIGAVAGAVVMVIRSRRPEALARKRRLKRNRMASPPPNPPKDPYWMLKLLLRATLPIGIAVVKKRLSKGAKPPPPAGGRADGLRDFPDPPRYGVRPAPLPDR
jgi:hypothetical protein